MTASRNESRQIKTAKGQFDILKKECIKVVDEETKIASSAKSVVFGAKENTIPMEPAVEETPITVEKPVIEESVEMPATVDVTPLVDEVTVDKPAEAEATDEMSVTDNSFEVSDAPQEINNGFSDITINPFETPVYDAPEEPVTPAYVEPTIEQSTVSEEPAEIDWKDLTQFEDFDEYFDKYTGIFGGKGLTKAERPKFYGEERDFEREKRVQLNKIENKKLKKDFEEQVEVIEKEYAQKFEESNKKHAEEIENLKNSNVDILADKDNQISNLTEQLSKKTLEGEKYKEYLTDALKKNSKAVKYISGLKNKEKEFSESAGLDVVTKLQDIAKDLEKFDVNKVTSKSVFEIEEEVNSSVYGEVTETSVNEENEQQFDDNFQNNFENDVEQEVKQTDEEPALVNEESQFDLNLQDNPENNVEEEANPIDEEPVVDTPESVANSLIGEMDNIDLTTVPLDEPEFTETKGHKHR